MEHPGPLTAGPGATVSTAPVACPRCGAAAGKLPPLATPLFGTAAARRCLRCGGGWAVVDGKPRAMGCCRTCGLPLPQRGAPEPGDRCEGCAGRADVRGRPGDAVAAATVLEIQLGLTRRLRFVTVEGLGVYLDRVARRVAGAIPGAPRTARVALVDDPAWRSMVLPDGTAILSIGLLQGLADESELAFVIGRELAHVASGAAATSLSRIALASVARGAGQEADWSEAALELMRLGRGVERELEADRVAFAALGGLGYDPTSAIRCIERLQAALESGDERWAEVGFALPVPAERLRALSRARAAVALDGRIGRTNREPFRRVLRQCDEGFLPVDGKAALNVQYQPLAEPSGGHRRLAVWVAAGVLAVAALVALALALVR